MTHSRTGLPGFGAALALAATLIFANPCYAQITMGMVGDSLTDDYLGGAARANNNLAAYSWGQVLAATRPADFSFGGYKPVGEVWDTQIRYSGYQNNWATSGGVASNSTKLNVPGFGLLPVTIFGASYLSSQTTGLAQQINSGDISTVFASIGSNDFFYRTTLFGTDGSFNPNPNAVIDQAFITDIANSILTNLDTLHNAGTASGHPVDLVLGLIPDGTAGGSNPEILAGIGAVNQLLVQGASTRGIAVVNLFGWASDPGRVDKHGAIHIGHLVIVPGSSASGTDIDPAGAGPCNTYGCALPSHANHFSAEDGLHPNTIIQAFMANQVIAALNNAYGHHITPITDAEILTLVGVPLPLACQEDADGDGLGDGPYTFEATSCPANTVSVPLITNTEHLGATLQSDNCPYAANPGQQDTNADGVGDACQGDRDSDSISDAGDNCPTSPNNNQLDTDADSSGDACDNDDDNDGVVDTDDAFPLDASETTDSDNDTIGNNADNCPLTANADQLDSDGDNLGDVCDTYPQDNLLLLQRDGAAAHENFASGVAMADMNNDGVPDVIVGAPMADVSTDKKTMKKAGVIRIVSGVDGSILRSLDGKVAGQRFGTAFAIVNDRNSDGVPDIIVGEPLADITTTDAFGKSRKSKDAGRVALYSGNDGALLQVLAEGSHNGDHFGSALAVGDVNNDAQVDLVVGVPRADVVAKDAGQVTVFNGLGQNILYQRNGEQAGEQFGAAVAVDNGHLFIGSPLHGAAALKHAGRVSVFNSGEGSSTALLTVDGDAKGDNFGAAISAHSNSWAASAPASDSAGKNAGRVQLFSGLNATPTIALEGNHPGDRFGTAVSLQGDLNRDGKSDLVIGAAKTTATAAVGDKTTRLKHAGLVQVLSGAALL